MKSDVEFEAAARQMAILFGLNSDAPFPSELRASLQARNAFDARVWRLPEDTPAWRILALELRYQDEPSPLKPV